MITITINTENAAFDDYDAELAEIFKNLSEAAFMADLYNEKPIKDSNGNTVGEVTVKHER